MNQAQRTAFKALMSLVVILNAGSALLGYAQTGDYIVMSVAAVGLVIFTWVGG